MTEHHSGGCEVNEREVTTGEFIVAGGDPPKIEEFAEIVFDFVTLAIVTAKPPRFYAAVFGRRDGSLDSIRGQHGPDRIAIIGFVRDDAFHTAAFARLSINLGKGDTVVALAFGQEQDDSGPFIYAGSVQLGGQAAARATKSLLRTVFFGAPAAWGCTGMLVLSTKSWSAAGVTPCWSTLHKPRHTPLSSQRRKRMYTALHAPNTAGRSRHGAPVRARKRTASINSRSVNPAGAPRGSFTSMSAASNSFQSSSVTMRLTIPSLNTDGSEFVHFNR